MVGEEKINYEIQKIKDDSSAIKTVCIVKRKSSAVMTVDRLIRNLTDQEKREGWSFQWVITTQKAPSTKKAPRIKNARTRHKIGRWTGR